MKLKKKKKEKKEERMRVRHAKWESREVANFLTDFLPTN